MFFTQEDYRKIEKWLLANSKKDTDFVGAATPLTGTETIAFVQDGHNVKVLLNDLTKQLFLLGASDFLNITDKYGESYITLSQAISLIPYKSRKTGQVITFLNEEGKWVIYQFRGTAKNQWNNLTLWVDIIKSIVVDSILPDEEDLTGVRIGSNEYLKFKNKDYNPENFSGLGRNFVRKNIVDGINLLSKEQFPTGSTIYVIQYDHDLNGTTLDIPSNSTLYFEGGSISNGTLHFNNTILDGDPLFKDAVSVTGTINNSYLRPEWFGASSTLEDNTKAINSALYAAYILGVEVVRLRNTTYNISGTLNIYPYCSLIGDNELNNKYSGTQIVQNGKVDAITFVRESGDLLNIGVKNLSIVCNISTESSGISVISDAASLFNCTFDGIFIKGFKNGININISGNLGIGYNRFEKCSIVYCNIGINIEGNSIANNSPWCNYNSFVKNEINNHIIGGVYIHGVTSTQEIDFSNNTFEGIGKGYTIDLLNTFPFLGFAIKVDSLYRRGAIKVRDNYIEIVYPVRTGVPTSNEYTVEGRVFPNRIKNEGAVLQFNNCEAVIENNFIGNFCTLVRVEGSFGLTINSNNYGMNGLIYANSESELVNYLVYINSSNFINSFLCVKEVQSNNNSRFPYTQHLFENDYVFDSSITLSTDIITFNQVNSGTTSSNHYNLSNRQLSAYKIYLDSTKNNQVSILGLSPITAKPTLASVFSAPVIYKNTINIDVIGDSTVGDFTDSNIINKGINIRSRSKNNNKLSYSANSRNLKVSRDITFESLYIQNNNLDYPYFLETVEDSVTINFINCTIEYSNLGKYLVKAAPNCTINFINCNFVTPTETTGEFKIVYSEGTKVFMSNTTFQSGCTYSEENFLNEDGTLTTRVVIV